MSGKTRQGRRDEGGTAFKKVYCPSGLGNHLVEERKAVVKRQGSYCARDPVLGEGEERNKKRRTMKGRPPLKGKGRMMYPGSRTILPIAL